MGIYPVGSEIQFVRQIERTDTNRVINIDEKGSIVAVAPDGTYTVKLLTDEPPVTGITDEDIAPSILQPGDALPAENEEPTVRMPPKNE